MKELLQIRDLSIRFKSKSYLRSLIEGSEKAYINAVCSVSLKINRAETFAIVGESGAGKTTLARSIIGLITPYEGNILYNGEEICGLPNRIFAKYRRNITMMFQDPIGSLSPRMNVKGLITEPFKIHRVKKYSPKYETDRLLEMVNLPRHLSNLYPHQLSGGQARRVCMARALALSPSLIIADEPTAGLDVSIQGDILNLILQLQEREKLSFLIITHNLSVVRHISTHMAIMYLGRLVETGDTDDIFKTPSHPYTSALLSSTPDPNPDAPRKRLQISGESPSLIERPNGCEFHTRCPYAQNKCRLVRPKTRDLGNRRSVTCHFNRNEMMWKNDK